MLQLLSCSWPGQVEKNHEDLRMHSDFKAGPAKYETCFLTMVCLRLHDTASSTCMHVSTCVCCVIKFVNTNLQ